MSEQPNVYVQVEAVNIYAAVFDTSQLSVIRGGSYLLARAIEAVAKHGVFREHLETLSIGASVGLFRVISNHPAVDLVEAIANWLSTQPRFRCFTFVVEHCQTQSLSLARELLAAKVRFRQLRQVTRVPDRVSPDRGDPPRICALEGRRVADSGPEVELKGRPCALSETVRRRLKRGRRLRSEIYLRILERDLCSQDDHDRLREMRGRLAGMRFSDDLEGLARCDAFRALNNKIAVIYLDGNRFGAIQRQCAKTPAEQIRFDRDLRRLRARLLMDLLEPLLPAPAGLSGWLETIVTPRAAHDSPALRLETLLWGGDEMTLVVPAWLGFDLLQRFYRLSQDWCLGEPLTHAGGIVFCQASTPIRKIHGLARQLAEDIKDQHPQGRTESRFDYLVLESIDYPVEPELSFFRRGRYGPIAAARGAMAPCLDWESGTKAAAQRLLMSGGLARGGVFALARSIRTEAERGLFGDDEAQSATPWDPKAQRGQDPTPFQSAERRLVDLAEERSGLSVCDDLRTVAAALGADSRDQRTRAWLWLHLTELWDYLVPERDYDADGRHQ